MSIITYICWVASFKAHLMKGENHAICRWLMIRPTSHPDRHRKPAHIKAPAIWVRDGDHPPPIDIGHPNVIDPMTLLLHRAVLCSALGEL